MRDGPIVPAATRPNPKNIEHDAKIAELQQRITRYDHHPQTTCTCLQDDRWKAEKAAWKQLTRLPQNIPPPLGFPPPPTSAPSSKRYLPDADLLDKEDQEILQFLTDPKQSSAVLRSDIQTRISAIQSRLEFQVDRLKDGVHKLGQRVSTAGREADEVLGLCAESLRTREEGERKRLGTREVPVMEVLRSLGRILPEGDGGSAG